jgi:hypothetical protein
MTIGSVSDPDPYSMTAWIRIHIPKADQYRDPRGLKRAKIKETTQPKDIPVIRHKKYKKEINWYR